MEQSERNAPEVFRCVECRQWVPVQYRSSSAPYGMEGPVCCMCVSYWDYLEGDPDEPLDDEEDEEFYGDESKSHDLTETVSGFP